MLKLNSWLIKFLLHFVSKGKGKIFRSLKEIQLAVQDLPKKKKTNMEISKNLFWNRRNYNPQLHSLCNHLIKGCAVYPTTIDNTPAFPHPLHKRSACEVTCHVREGLVIASYKTNSWLIPHPRDPSAYFLSFPCKYSSIYISLHLQQTLSLLGSANSISASDSWNLIFSLVNTGSVML